MISLWSAPSPATGAESESGSGVRPDVDGLPQWFDSAPGVARVWHDGGNWPGKDAVERHKYGLYLVLCLERAKGIEPSFSAWEADVLPLNYARGAAQHYRAGPMVLSDRSIRESLSSGQIVIDPLGDDCVQPSSVDLHVDRYFRLFRNHTMRVIDVREDLEDLTELVDIAEGDALILHPGEFVLGSTLERVRLPDDLVARLEGKSSLGRLGLLIHSTAGFVDAGWDGHLTLELSNVANLPITVYPGMKIGQISFLKMTTAADRPYGSQGLGSKYQGQRGPTQSRYFENFRS